jgi:polar amino acid transport system substrate-binding protein
MKLKKYICSFLFVGVLFFHGPSQGREIIVLVEDYPPWSIVKPKPIHGINIEIVKEISRRLDLKPRYILYPWRRCLKMMELGKGDIMTGLLKRPEREEYMLYVEPPYKTSSTKAFYVPKGQKNRILKYEDLFNLNIGTTIGSKYFEPFDSDSRIIKYPIATDLQNLLKVEKNRLDALIGTGTHIDYLIYSEGFYGEFEKTVFRYDRQINVHMAISKKSPYADELPLFNKTMEQLVTEGTIDKIIDTFFVELNK